MTSRLYKTHLLLAFFLATIGIQKFCNGQVSDGRQFWQAYSKAIEEFGFEDAKRHPSIYSILEISKLCNQLGKPETAIKLFARAEKIVNVDGKRQYRQSLFQAALTFDNLALAERIARESDEKVSLGYLDSVDLERLSRGEKDALKNFPREPLDFWKATEQGNAYVRAGDYEAAEKFIKELDIPHEENDPKTVGAFVYENIAAKYQKKGDINNARKWIDKAMAHGGNLFYTGFSIKSKKLSLYNEFDKGLERHAKMGAAYGGHMSRELLKSLVNELIDADRLEDAKQTIKLLKRQSDRDGYLTKVAIEEAVDRSSKLEETLTSIQDKNQRSAAKIGIATRLWLSGEKEMGQKLLDAELAKINSWDASNSLLYQAAGHAVGAMYQMDRFKKLLEAPVDDGLKAYWLHKVLNGYTAAQSAKKNKNMR